MKDRVKILFPAIRIAMGIFVLAFSAIVLDIRYWNALLWIMALLMCGIIAWSVRDLIGIVKRIKSNKHP